MQPPRPVVDHSKQFERLYNARKHLPGDIAEFGVYNGGSTVALAEFGRRVWAFDTFEGLPEVDYTCIDGVDNKPKKFTPDYDLETLWKMCPSIVPVKGRFVDTFPTVPEDVKFMLVYVDCDYYQSHVQVLEWLPTRLVPGAAIVLDDYRALEGVRKAVDVFVKKYKLTLSERGEIIEWLK